mmetsp:Transcript_12427/g.26445  ORF Transcript_12427/g.26445 Transcript_12427/m.26445 type:complete len:86 (-) Transcript_12427:96-353(-)
MNFRNGGLRGCLQRRCIDDNAIFLCTLVYMKGYFYFIDYLRSALVIKQPTWNCKKVIFGRSSCKQYDILLNQIARFHFFSFIHSQ